MEASKAALAYPLPAALAPPAVFDGGVAVCTGGAMCGWAEDDPLPPLRADPLAPAAAGARCAILAAVAIERAAVAPAIPVAVAAIPAPALRADVIGLAPRNTACMIIGTARNNPIGRKQAIVIASRRAGILIVVSAIPPAAPAPRVPSPAAKPAPSAAPKMY